MSTTRTATVSEPAVSLDDIHTDLSIARRLTGAALMAVQSRNLPDEDMHPLAALLDVIETRLAEVMSDLRAFERGQQ